VSFNIPLGALPTAVLTAETTTASFINPPFLKNHLKLKNAKLAIIRILLLIVNFALLIGYFSLINF
jgi:hypothetical protein